MTTNLLVIGAGQAAGQLAVSLRQSGFDGHITIVGDEPLPPYQRPPLSKKYLAGELEGDRLLIKPNAFYADNDVELVLGRHAESIDREAKTVTLDDGRKIGWDKLVLATGSSVRKLDSPGCDLPGIHYLRTAADVDAIREEFSSGRRLVIVGGGYIGLEVAAIAMGLGLEVHVIEQMPRLLSRVASPEISTFYERVHSDAGVDIHLDCAVLAFGGEDHVQHVSLSDGREIDTDLVIVGIGIVPNTHIAAAAGLDCDNGILGDEFCQTSDADVLAIGDCTNHPNPILKRRLRLESVPNALEQARTAAATLCGERRAYAQVPWFWSDQYDLKLQIVGLTEGYDETVIRGSMADNKFACFYLREGRLIAVDAVNSPREFMFSKPAVAAGAKIPREVLADPDQSLKDADKTWPAG